MRVCFYAGNYAGGGTGRAVSIVGNELKRRTPHEIYALGHSRDGKEDVYHVDFPVTYLYSEKMSMTRAILKDHYLKKVTQYVKQNHIDVLVCCLELLYPIGLLVAKRCGIKLVTWLHTNPDIGNDYRFERESRWLGARFSDCNVVLTKDALELYQHRFPGQRNVQIYNPVDSALLNYTGAYDANSKRIISVGRLNYAKNYERLLDIADRVKQRHPDWQWDIYGEGEDQQKLERKIAEKQLGDFVHLCGQRRDIYSIYPQYAMMVMTSRYEGFPMTLLEAASRSLPMVVFDIKTGPNEIIQNGVNGYLCSKDSDDEMVERIEALISSAELRKACARNSMETAKQFAIDRILPEWEKLLETFYVKLGVRKC
ncbi:MAG: glycosyltransferase family 4 protein [bacterium]|nr:glycosyltransferase family 4 protein [bacterium]